VRLLKAAERETAGSLRNISGRPRVSLIHRRRRREMAPGRPGRLKRKSCRLRRVTCFVTPRGLRFAAIQAPSVGGTVA
jgi:hypothetical protein